MSYKQLDIIPYTFFAGNHYGATLEQIDSNELYVIDIPGVISIKGSDKVKRPIKIIYLDAPEEIRLERMLSRGDNKEKVEERITNDDERFSDTLVDSIKPDIRIDASQPLSDVVFEVQCFIDETEEEF